MWLGSTFALDARSPLARLLPWQDLRTSWRIEIRIWLEESGQGAVSGLFSSSSALLAVADCFHTHTHVSHVRYVFLTEHRRSQSCGEFFWNSPTPPNLPTPPSEHSGSSIGQFAKALGKFEVWCILAAFLGPSGVPRAGFPKLWPGHLVL